MVDQKKNVWKNLNNQKSLIRSIEYEKIDLNEK